MWQRRAHHHSQPGPGCLYSTPATMAVAASYGDVGATRSVIFSLSIGGFLRPLFVAGPSLRLSDDGSTVRPSTISHQWVSGIARILATMPGEGEEGTPKKTPTRGMVSTTRGDYACLGGPCGHGCGTPHQGSGLRRGLGGTLKTMSFFLAQSTF